MQPSIQTHIIKKLFFWGTIFSLLMGSFVGYQEMCRIDEEVKMLAFEDAEYFYEPYYEYYENSTPEGMHELKTHLQKRIEQDRFILLELYYNDRQKLIKTESGNINAVVAKLKDKQPTHSDDGIDYARIFHGGSIYLKIIAPFFTMPNKDTGYFEGIYKVSEQQTESILSRIVITIVQVVVIIIAVTFLLYPVILSLNRDVIRINSNLLSANIETLNVLGDAIAKRDSDTNAHNYRVTIYAITLGEKVGLNKKQIQMLVKGAFLHDVGKIGISDNILLKPGKLTAEEFEVMKKHVPYGVEIIENSQWIKEAQEVVECHHEKFDGSGYPKGLNGREIPIVARVFAIVDVFDALTSERPYKKPFSLEKSMQIIQEGTGNHFDPDLVEQFSVISSNLHLRYSGIEDESFLSSELNILIKKYF